ncbi:MAG: hypothetical protein TEF_14555 [Rhizobiales bacterium NRL2]|nr:MAG: hypothetical protein TEF_14555 [Rhizobiales bacterium NRL2]
MVWRIWGKGRPIVLLHGGHGSWEHWIRNIGPLSKHGKVIAGDLPGLGDSDPLSPPVDAPRLAEIVVSGIRKLAPEGDLVLGGFSLGSVITAHAAAALGTYVRQVFLLGPAGLGAGWADNSEGMLRRPYRASVAEQRAVVRHNLGVSMIGVPSQVDELAVDIQFRLTSRRRRLIGMPISDSSATLDVMPDIASRAHVIAGDRDRYLQPNVAACLGRLNREFPAMRTTIVKGAGHWVAYDAADRVNDLFVGSLGVH